MCLNGTVVFYNNLNIILKFSLYPLLFNGTKTFAVIFEHPGLIAFLVGLIFLSALWETPINPSYSSAAKNIPTFIFVVTFALKLFNWAIHHGSTMNTAMNDIAPTPAAAAPARRAPAAAPAAAADTT